MKAGKNNKKLGREVNPSLKVVRHFAKVGKVIYDVNDIVYRRALKKQAKLETAGKALFEEQVKNLHLPLDA